MGSNYTFKKKKSSLSRLIAAWWKLKYFNFGSFKVEIYYYIKKQQAKTDDLVGLLNNSVRSQDEEDS